jgi:hypothetical protein
MTRLPVSTVSEQGLTPPNAPPRPGFTKQGIVSSETLKDAEQSWADQQVTTSSCAFCDWTHEGTAGEGRDAARAHREQEHPEACVKKPRLRRRIVKKALRSADEEAQISVDTREARRLRSEREVNDMLAKIERGRLRDAAAKAALDGEAAA